MGQATVFRAFSKICSARTRQFRGSSRPLRRVRRQSPTCRLQSYVSMLLPSRTVRARRTLVRSWSTPTVLTSCQRIHRPSRRTLVTVVRRETLPVRSLSASTVRRWAAAGSVRSNRCKKLTPRRSLPRRPSGRLRHRTSCGVAALASKSNAATAAPLCRSRVNARRSLCDTSLGGHGKGRCERWLA